MTGRGPDETPPRRDADGTTGSGARAGRDRAWRALRTLVGLLLLGWLLAALFAPPNPFVFLLVLAPAWLLAVPLSWYLVYRDGYDRLRASRLYAPSTSAPAALAAFVVVALLLKVVGTVALNVEIGSRPYAADAALSVVALGAAYLMVYLGAGGESGEQ